MRIRFYLSALPEKLSFYISWFHTQGDLLTLSGIPSYPAVSVSGSKVEKQRKFIFRNTPSGRFAFIGFGLAQQDGNKMGSSAAGAPHSPYIFYPT
jgi:hypothetical protein